MKEMGYSHYAIWLMMGGGALFNIGCTSTTNQVTAQSQFTTNLPNDNFTPITTLTISADGAGSGLSAYDLITKGFGKGTIESPDLYAGNHTDVVHIVEESDEVVGNHFVFLSHRDLDKDRNKNSLDRQRNEIKTFDRSDPTLLGYQGETVQYQWRFKVSAEMELSRKFSHFFQIKAKNATENNANGNDEQPIITLSGAQKKDGQKQLQVRYSSGVDAAGAKVRGRYLARADWTTITDEWVEILVQVTYAEQGALKFTLTRLRDNERIIALNEVNIDMWRGNDAKDFARPKWGIYRSIADKDSLRSAEEQVRFADFTIRKGLVR